MDFQDILDGEPFYVDDNKSIRFVLLYNEWNDFGYHTLFDMSVTFSCGEMAHLHLRIMNKNQRGGDIPVWKDGETYVFLSEDCANFLHKILTPDQRNRFEKILGLTYDVSQCRTENVFRMSILRNFRPSELKENLAKAKEIMQSSENGVKFDVNDRTSVKEFLNRK